MKPEKTEHNKYSSYLLFHALALTAAALLMWTAFLNRYPLFYPDSAGYICFISPYELAGYHYFLKFVSMRLSLWTVIFAQSVITAYLLMRVSCLMLKTHKHREFIAFTIIALLAALTDISKYVCWIMPDIFTSWSFLGGMLIYLSRSLYDRLFAGTAIVLSLSCHNSNIATAVASFLALGVVGVMLRSKTPHILKTAKQLAAIILVSFISVSAINYSAGFGFSLFPPKKWSFLFAKFEHYGVLPDTFKRYCPVKKWKMCAHAAELKAYQNMEIWEIMWRAESPLQRFSMCDDQKEMREVLWCAFKCRPWTVIKYSIKDTLTQLNNVDITDGIPMGIIFRGDLRDFLMRTIRDVYPRELKHLLSSNQYNYLPVRLRLAPVKDRIFQYCVLSYAVVLLVPLFLKKRFIILSNILAAALFIFLNAFVTASVSDVWPRYSMRVMWLMPYILLLATAKLIGDPTRSKTPLEQ